MFIAMKMEKRENVESFEQLEERAQQRLRPGPLIKAALRAGVLVFIVPAGPWMSHESLVNIMGRGMGTNAIAAVVGHFLLALLYGWIIAMCIFRPPLGAAILFGALLAAPLCGLNYLILALGAGFRGNELHVGIAHFMFCLFFSVAYRAMAVPRARRKEGGIGAPVKA